MTQKAAILVADRSGSMKDNLANTVTSLNEYIDGIRSQADLSFTFLRFDTISTDIVLRRIPIAEVKSLSAEDIEPRAGTPLIDALAIAIGAAKQDYKDDDRVVIVCMTDGHENASREFTLDQLHDMIKERTQVGWQFVFLGASIDAYADSRKFGLSAGSTMSYNNANAHMASAAMRTVAKRSNAFYDSGRTVEFSMEDKQAVGDVFVPKGGEGGGATGGPKSVAKSLVDKIKL